MFCYVALQLSKLLLYSSTVLIGADCALRNGLAWEGCNRRVQSCAAAFFSSGGSICCCCCLLPCHSSQHDSLSSGNPAAGNKPFVCTSCSLAARWRSGGLPERSEGLAFNRSLARRSPGEISVTTQYKAWRWHLRQPVLGSQLVPSW